MKILVDADACPVKDAIIHTGCAFDIPVYLFIDTSHSLHYTEKDVTVITVDQGRDSVDFALANQAGRGDIAVTADYGLASMLLAKNAYVVHPNGFALDEHNIDILLLKRHIAQEMRRQRKGHTRFKKRSAADDESFKTYFYDLCKRLTEQNKSKEERLC